MNTEKWNEAMNLISERYIGEAIRPVRRGGRKQWIPALLSAAACLGLVTTACILSRPKLLEPERSWPVKYVKREAAGQEILEIPRWDAMEIYNQYNRIDWNSLSYSARSGRVGEAQLGKKLGDTTAHGRDEYAAAAGENADRSLAASVYEIKGISADCAVAVRYDGREAYYAAVNSFYRPDTLGQFMRDLNLDGTLQFNYILYSFRKPSGEYADIRFDSPDDAKIRELLLSAENAENKYDELNFQLPAEILQISVSIPLLGYENISISVHEDGCLMTNILDTGKLFFVGEENTRAFIDYVLNECDGYEAVYTEEGEPLPE